MPHAANDSLQLKHLQPLQPGQLRTISQRSTTNHNQTSNHEWCPHQEACRAHRAIVPHHHPFPPLPRPLPRLGAAHIQRAPLRRVHLRGPLSLTPNAAAVVVALWFPCFWAYVAVKCHAGHRKERFAPTPFTLQNLLCVRPLWGGYKLNGRRYAIVGQARG
ncbi:hypothetical protein PZA11_006694 [Diplocarpon coronariae]